MGVCNVQKRGAWGDKNTLSAGGHQWARMERGLMEIVSEVTGCLLFLMI